MPQTAEQFEIQGLAAALDSHAVVFGLYHPKTVDVAHQLAKALWCADEINQAIDLLDQALEGISSSSGAEDSVRIGLLETLGQIMVQQAHWEPARLIYREVLESCIRRSGPNHPSSLAAKGDLSVVLFEIGDEDRADKLEQEALEGAQSHLGKHHVLTSVLAWNRALRFEKSGRLESARVLVLKELSWLLTHDVSSLEDDQKTIQTLLAQRLNWEAATAC